MTIQPPVVPARRVLLLAATTGYQTRAFEDAAVRLGVRLQYATDRCHVLTDPWRDAAIPIRFDRLEASVDAIAASAARLPIHGVLAVGDQPTLVAALAALRLGLPFHRPEGAAASRNKFLMRQRLREAGLPVPAFRKLPLSMDPGAVAGLTFPCVIKPLGLSGSRGVIRADDAAGFAVAFGRVRALLAAAPDAGDVSAVIVEQFIPGREFAIEGVMTAGTLQVLAIFDKPDPLDGPLFEETLYITPSAAPPVEQDAIAASIAAAARTMGLVQGPVHAECRVNDTGVFVLEVAARPIGGLCARSLRFVSKDAAGPDALETLLLRHALGEPLDGFTREPGASGVMMIPIPRRGIYRRVAGDDAARHVEHVVAVEITAKADQVLIPLPEGASYLGFIFARAARAADVDRALRAAHDRLAFTVDPEVRMVQSGNG